MTWQEAQDELRELSNEISDLSKQVRTHSTDFDQLRLICVKLRSAQLRLEVLLNMNLGAM